MNTNRTATANEIKETRAMIAAIMTTARRLYTYRKINKEEARDVLGRMLQGAHTAIENTNDRPELVELYRMQANELAQMLHEINRPDDLEKAVANAMAMAMNERAKIGAEYMEQAFKMIDKPAANCFITMLIEVAKIEAKEEEGAARAADVGKRLENCKTEEEAAAILRELAAVAENLAGVSSDSSFLAYDLCDIVTAGDIEGSEELQEIAANIVTRLTASALDAMESIENARGKYKGGARVLNWLECLHYECDNLQKINNKTLSYIHPNAAESGAATSCRAEFINTVTQRKTTKAPAVYITGNVLHVVKPRKDCKRYDSKAIYKIN